MGKLSDEIVHLSKVLEKQVPKGYHELVVEYVRQNIVSAIGNFMLMVILGLITFLLIKVIIKNYCSEKENFLFDEYKDPTLFGGAVMFIGTVLLISSFITLLCNFPDLFTNIQHAVAPNYYLIKSFIK